MLGLIFKYIITPSLFHSHTYTPYSKNASICYVHALLFCYHLLVESAAIYTMSGPLYLLLYSCCVCHAVADSWPEVLDDANAREDWGWNHEFGLEKMVKDMVEKLSRT